MSWTAKRPFFRGGKGTGKTTNTRSELHAKQQQMLLRKSRHGNASRRARGDCTLGTRFAGRKLQAKKVRPKRDLGGMKGGGLGRHSRKARTLLGLIFSGFLGGLFLALIRTSNLPPSLTCTISGGGFLPGLGGNNIKFLKVSEKQNPAYRRVPCLASAGGFVLDWRSSTKGYISRGVHIKKRHIVP